MGSVKEKNVLVIKPTRLILKPALVKEKTTVFCATIDKKRTYCSRLFIMMRLPEMASFVVAVN